MAETVAAKGGGASHILVVEDDPAYREALGHILQREGYSVSLTADFRGALEILESEQPVSLMLVDIVMPDRVNGIALARMARLRQGPDQLAPCGAHRSLSATEAGAQRRGGGGIDHGRIARRDNAIVSRRALWRDEAIAQVLRDQ
jgi:CheY-like chemotaxis protein